MNVTKSITRDYEKKTLGERGKKQSQTKPNKAKFKKAEMNVTSYITRGYENKPPIRAPKKQTQISKRQKPMQTSLPQRIMKKTALSASGKTNPNKPNLSGRSLWRRRIKLADAPVACQSPLTLPLIQTTRRNCFDFVYRFRNLFAQHPMAVFRNQDIIFYSDTTKILILFHHVIINILYVFLLSFPSID